MSAAVLSADLSHVDTWLFDLDNTLYPLDSPFMLGVDARITAYTMGVTGLDHDAARALQKRYLREHGTTLAGLMRHHAIDAHDFLADVHDVALDALTPDSALHAAIARLPGRRLVFTNGSLRHAERVLAHLGLASLFETIWSIESGDLSPKPERAAFDKLIAALAVDPAKTAFFEDSVKNLAPAADLGMVTVLVGPHAAADANAFVRHRTADLTGFLDAARLSTRPLAEQMSPAA